jgi:hypothetical protein
LPDPGILSMKGGAAVWTGREAMLLFEANVAYDPGLRSWRTIRNSCGAAASGVWTGRYSIAFGRAYDTATETCRTLPLEPDRPGGGYREFGVDVWTGREFVRWSGGNGADGAPRSNDGAVFTPAEDLTR